MYKILFTSLFLFSYSLAFSAEEWAEKVVENSNASLAAAILSNELITWIVFAVVALIFTFFISKIVQTKVTSALEDFAQWWNGREEVYSMVAKAINISVWIFGISMAAWFVQMDLAIFMWGIWIWVWFGLQALLSNFISWVIIILQWNYSVGNLIEVMWKTWTIREMNTLFMQIEQFDWVKFFVPNSKFLSETVLNIHANDKRRCEILVWVDYDTDIVKAKKVIANVIESFPSILAAPSYSIILTEFDDSSIWLKVMFWLNTKDDFFNIRSNVMETINLAFKQSWVTIPFPQVTLSNRSGFKLEK